MSNLEAPKVAAAGADQTQLVDRSVVTCPACGAPNARVVAAPRRSSLVHLWCAKCHKQSAVLSQAPIPVMW